jgi:hypothetical protein
MNLHKTQGFMQKWAAGGAAGRRGAAGAGAASSGGDWILVGCYLLPSRAREH